MLWTNKMYDVKTNTQKRKKRWHAVPFDFVCSAADRKMGRKWSRNVFQNQIKRIYTLIASHLSAGLTGLVGSSAPTLVERVWQWKEMKWHFDYGCSTALYLQLQHQKQPGSDSGRVWRNNLWNWDARVFTHTPRDHRLTFTWPVLDTGPGRRHLLLDQMKLKQCWLLETHRCQQVFLFSVDLTR